jgi:hypothetical protein
MPIIEAGLVPATHHVPVQTTLRAWRARQEADRPSPVPTNYAELFIGYGNYLKAVVIQQGIAPESADDVVSYILERLISRDVLSMFDPDGFVASGRGTVSPKFRTFITAFVYAYCRGQREKLQITAYRERPSTFEEGTLCAGATTEIGIPGTESAVDAVNDRLGSYTVAGIEAKLFLSTIEDCTTPRGQVDFQAMARALGVTKSVILTGMQELQECLRP